MGNRPGKQKQEKRRERKYIPVEGADPVPLEGAEGTGA